jgi:anti-sigma B factor antagonist
MTGMHLAADTRGSWHIISVKGRVDSVTANELTAVLLAAVGSNTQVAVDCSNVEYISSAGLASLLEGARTARSAHREFRVCAPSPRVKQVFEISGLRNLLDIHEGLPC